MQVEAELVNDEHGVSEHIRWLADGPVSEVPSFDGYQIDGVNFSTKDRDNDRQVQCSGVSLLAVNHDTTFYGVIKEIWELDYHSFRVPVFLCDWADLDKSIKIDDLGYTLVNLNKLGHFNDPFVLGTDVRQVCYVDDPLNKHWSVVIRCPEKDYHLGDDDDDVEIELEQDMGAGVMPSSATIDVGVQTSSYKRADEEGIYMEL